MTTKKLSNLEKKLPNIIEKLPGFVIQEITENPNIGEGDEEHIHIGYCHPIDIPLATKAIMDWWVNLIDSYLDHAEEGSTDYAKLMAWRGFTFDEFSTVLSAEFGQDDYKHLRVFDYFMIVDELHKKLAFINKEADHTTYLELLQETEIPIRDFLVKKKVPVYFPLKALHLHSYLVGQSGSGKSELIKLVIYDLQRKSFKKNLKTRKYRRSIVTMEPHGDFSKEILGFVMNKYDRERLIYIDPYIHKTAGVKEKYTPIINPFDIKDKSEESIDVYSQELADAFSEILKRSESSSSGSSLTIQMDALLKPCIATLLRMEDKVGTLKELQRFMNDEENEDLIQRGLKSPKETDRNFFRTGFRKNSLKTTKSGIYYRIQSLINSYALDKLLNGESTIDLQSALDSGKIVIFNLSKSNMGKEAAPVFGKLMIAMIQSIGIKRDRQAKRNRMPTYIFIDEFQNFVTNSVEDVLTEARKYRLHMLLSHQVLGQKMDTKMRNIILGNTNLKVVGKNGFSTLKALAEEIDVDVQSLKEIPKYSFYIHHKDSEKDAFMVKTPNFLVNETSEFYMTPKEKLDLLRYFMEESGYYVKVENDGIEHEPKRPTRTTPDQPNINGDDMINPRFTH